MKTFIKNNALSASIMLFILLFIIMKLLKPSFIFDKKGGIRHFGIGKTKKTVIPIWLVSMVLAIFSYILVMVYVRD